MRAILFALFLSISSLPAFAGLKHPTCQYLYGLTQRLDTIVNEQQVYNVSHDVWENKDGCTWTTRAFDARGSGEGALPGFHGWYDTGTFLVQIFKVRYGDNTAVAWVPGHTYRKSRYELARGCRERPRRYQSQGQTVLLFNPNRTPDKGWQSCRQVYE